MPFDMTPTIAGTMTAFERARHLRLNGKNWDVVAFAPRPFCTRDDRDDILRRVRHEEMA